MTRREHGLTLTEIVVTVGLLGIAAALAFGMQTRVSQLFRDQSNIAETQQTLRDAQDLLVRELRQAGYLANHVRTAVAGSPTVDLVSVSVANGAGAGGSDILRVIYADASLLTQVRKGGGAFDGTTTWVNSVTGWAAGDVALATRTGDPLRSHGCVLEITGTSNRGPTLSHDGSAAPWNNLGNPQCSAISTVWDDGYTVFTRLAAHSYRIKPSDRRGVLQLSPSGAMVANDWVDLAVGVVDLQVALKVYQPLDTTDVDGDGDPLRDWYSSNLMNDVTTMVANSELMAATVSLVVRTTKEVRGAVLAKTPDVLDPTANVNFNRIGDHEGTTLPVTDTGSMVHGDYIYRTVTTTVDLRNLGVGR